MTKLPFLPAILTIAVALIGPIGRPESAFGQPVAPTPTANAAPTAPSPSPAKSEKPLIQIAILLDTSNSMDGLIDQARAQLWKIVNEFVYARRRGEIPRIEVALYEYGNNGISDNSHFVRMVIPLTNDLDKISEELFKLKTNGGEEYCGAVIQHATDHLSWNSRPDVFRAVFIAGNEPFSQGPVPFQDACKHAISKGILVNTIFCGSLQEGLATGWKEGATLADGSFLSIDANQKIVDIPAPQDTVIQKLAQSVNDTYIPYGKQGMAGQQRQALQDRNALQQGAGAFASRGATKNSMFYSNTTWDLVDAVSLGKLKLEELKEEDLPAVLKGLSAEKRKEYVQKKTQERKDLQKAMATAVQQRETYVAAERKKRDQANAENRGKAEQTLSDAVISVVRLQCRRAQWEFAPATPPSSPPSQPDAAPKSGKP